MKRFTAPLLILAAGAATLLGNHPAQAHGSVASGVLAGLTHPLLGLDHLSMLIAVGAAASVFSARLLLWAAVGAVIGATAGAWGLPVPGAEVLAALAVAATGGLVLVAGQTLLGGGSGLVVALGVAVHALLHGLEAPADGASLLWWSGALISSVLVCGGAYQVFKSLPLAVAKAAAWACLAMGGALALVPLALQVSGAAG